MLEIEVLYYVAKKQNKKKHLSVSGNTWKLELLISYVV